MKHDLKNRLFLLSFLMIASVYLISCNSSGSSNGSQNQTTTESENQPALIFHEDFENYNSDNWYQTDSSAWKIEKEGDNSFIALVKQSEYAPLIVHLLISTL